ncbi:MAG: phosphatidyl inositol kinase, partial [Watsoniomyces obsoletus]
DAEDDKGIQAVEGALEPENDAAALGRVRIRVGEVGEARRQRRIAMPGDAVPRGLAHRNGADGIAIGQEVDRQSLDLKDGQDADFKERMYAKQIAVMKGQAWNVVETLKTSDHGPLELTRRARVCVWDDIVEIPIAVPLRAPSAEMRRKQQHVRTQRLNEEHEEMDITAVATPPQKPAPISAAAWPGERPAQPKGSVMSAATEAVSENHSTTVGV